MGRKIWISLGKVSEDQLKEGIGAALEKIGTSLLSVHGNAVRTKIELVNAQNEITSDNRSVALKSFHQRLRLRKGYREGVNIDVVWHRGRPDEVLIELSTMTLFLEWCFRATIVIAGVIAIGCAIQMKVVSRHLALLLFAAAFSVLMIPYFLLRMAVTVAGRLFLRSIEDVVRHEITPSAN
ncbi:MAG TPA: hypothetical protein VKX17_16010 [Planctomycetota bacterium]|nr:hypothetical protein [Planctomycetota bacterium]